MSSVENTFSLEIGRFTLRFTKKDVQWAYKHPIYCLELCSLGGIATAYIISGGELHGGATKDEVLDYINKQMVEKRVHRLMLLSYPAAVMTDSLDLFVKNTIPPLLPSELFGFAEEEDLHYWFQELPEEWW